MPIVIVPKRKTDRSRAKARMKSTVKKRVNSKKANMGGKKKVMKKIRLGRVAKDFSDVKKENYAKK